MAKKAPVKEQGSHAVKTKAEGPGSPIPATTKAKKKPKAKPKVKAPQAPKQQHPTEIKPHPPTLAPKSELPKDYKHPIGHPKKGVTLPPSKEGAAFEKEREDERKRTAVPPDRNWYDLPGGKPPGGNPPTPRLRRTKGKSSAKKAAPKDKK